MNIRLLIGSILLLLSISIVDGAMYLKYRSKVTKEITKREELKKDFEKVCGSFEKTQEKEPKYGYSDILEIMRIEPELKISRFDKSEMTKGKLIVMIEGDYKESSIGLYMKTISEMKSFLGLKNISIKGECVIINAEFKLTYK